MIKPVRAPFLELNFYGQSRGRDQDLPVLIEALLLMGARFFGDSFAHVGPNIRDQPFADVHAAPLETVTIKDLPDLKKVAANPGKRLVRATMIGAAGESRKVAETVTVLPISTVAMGVDRHPTAIWSDGDAFWGDPRMVGRWRANTVGIRAYRRFIEIVSAISPHYAAISVEDPMPCPIDLLQEGKRCFTFEDFYIERDFIQEASYRRMMTFYSGAYIEHTSHGMYISCNKPFNPERRSIDRNAVYANSEETTRILNSEGRWQS